VRALLTLATLAGALLLLGCDGDVTDGEDLSLADGSPADAALADRAAADSAAGADMSENPDGSAATDSSPAADSGSHDQAPPPDAGAPDSSLAAPDSAAPAMTGCIKGTFKAYYGNYHAHTSYSDGKKTPKDAFKYARDVAKLDVQIITDHLEQLYLPFPMDRWGKCKSQAAAETKAGKFLAACGYEYGSAFTSKLTSAGHANVFFNSKLMPAVQVNFKDFYKTLAACKTCIGQVNHPGDEKDQHFDKFKYNAAADARMNLFEFNSKPAWTWFFVALDNGWHLSPMYNQDNHSANWGTANNNRSGLLMTALDLPSMYKAMAERRTFMTEDKNASIIMKAGACWMGSILKGASAVTLSVAAADADGADAFTTIELFGKAKKLLATTTCKGTNACNASFPVKATQSPYFVARARQKDGDTLVSAPIWLTP